MKIKVLSSFVFLILFIGFIPVVAIAQTDTPTAGQIWKEPVTGMEFVWVPGGCYEMGCGSWTSDCASDEKPVHEVCVDGFWMGKTEVTQGQWKQIIGNNPAKFKKDDNFPVENVLYEKMEKFIKKLSSLNKGAYKFRFPTEAEWEYACRSGGKFEKHAGGSDLDQVAWCKRNSNLSTHAVGTKAPNGLGLFDMNGNVHEWVADTYKVWAYRKHERNNPFLEVEAGEYTIMKVFRGGSWNSKPKYARCAARASEVALEVIGSRQYRMNDLGFRLVRSK